MPESPEMLIARTNKAELIRQADGTVIKRYFTANACQRAAQDQLSLESINRQFGCVRRDEWQYRIVQPVWFDIDQGLVCTELVSGSVLAELPLSELNAAEYHAGIWLALYHHKVLAGDCRGLIYTDFTVNNLFVNLAQQAVVAIDPGMAWQHTTGYVYEDVVKHLHSAIVGLVVKRRASPSILCSFLLGYESAAAGRRPLWVYYAGWWRETWRLCRDYGKKSALKYIAFMAAVMVLLPFYLLFVPAYLMQARNRAEPRV